MKMRYGLIGIRPLRGKPTIVISFEPRLNYAQGETCLSPHEDFIVAKNEAEDLYLYSSLPSSLILSQRPMALEHEEYLLLTYHERIETPTLLQTRMAFEKTKAYWEAWSNDCRLPKYRSFMASMGARILMRRYSPILPGIKDRVPYASGIKQAT